MTERKPRDDEIDVYGVSDRGKVRANNEDHFLLASVHRRVNIVDTNLSERDRLPLGDQRLAFMAMVADGVGGATGGERASAIALETASQYVVSALDCYDRAAAIEGSMAPALQDAALKSHEAVLELASAEGDGVRMATTLTLWMGVWPWYYLLQVGDSRYYLYRDDKLTQVTRDQTIAQELVDSGVFTRDIAERSQFKNVLSSAIGGESSLPVITRLRADWGNIHLLCTDGLTKHVSDEQIAQRLASMTSSKQVCDQLLQDALDAGGTDNITIVVGRATPSE
ncbi:MAG TPA: protein phosphatase 2C domain-containing protein [Gemmatimonadaceae bacterium]|nr:protein phosphatase 2C domain-containing protein [Gemmatimonadaceae bacterium]